ncbi:MAG: hypothetical protein IPJ81_06765 [Chitinophagaceae bacterium]|nr:hypothetical protein [Chitinophagaceae bacterium]
MTIKNISYNLLLQAIKVAFENDMDIFKFYDPNENPKNIDDIVEDIGSKILEYEGSLYKGIFDEDKLIGYFVYIDNALISFALNIKYRVKEWLDFLYDSIKKELGLFICCLWNTNTRAIKWLQKKNMRINYFDNNITELICQ